MTKNVCAVVVTFNRKELFIETIDSLIKQTHPIEKLYIIDNASKDNTFEFFLEKYNLIENEKNLYSVSGVILSYIKLNVNTGGSGGFHTGLEIAYKESNYDYFWIMDDDAEPEANCLENLLLNITPNDGFLAPVIVHKESGEVQYHHHKKMNSTLTKEYPIPSIDIRNEKIIDLDATAFVGPLISREAIEKVGLPEKDYFIWLDDTEYTYRISRVLSGRLLTDTIIYHKDKRDSGNSILNIWKHFYAIRNRLLWIRKYKKGLSEFTGIIIVLRQSIVLGAKILIQSKWKNNRVFVMKHLKIAVKNGLNKRDGKFIDPVEFIKTIKR